jgi:hypothetical protein
LHLCGHADHLDEFCFRRKRIEKRRFEDARNSYMMSSFIFHLILILVLRLTLLHISLGPNYHSYGFGSRERRFEPRRFGYGPRHHHGDRFPRRSDFSAGGSHTHFEPRNLDGPRFPVVVHIPLSQVMWCKRL